MKINTLEELDIIRAKFNEDFKGKPPDYLTKYLDFEENRLILETSGRDPKLLEELYGNKYQSEYDIDVTKGNDNPLTYIAKEERALSDDEVKAIITACGQDLYAFAVRYFPHYLRLPSNEVQRYIYKVLSDELGVPRKRRRGFKYAIAAPRRSAKSSIVSTIFPLWCVCYNKKKFIIMLSYTSSMAVDFLSDITREINNNALLRRDFPFIVGKGEKWRTDDIVTRNQVRIMALGTGNQIRGRKFGKYRPDLLILDDIETSEMVKSKTQREDIQDDWFKKDVLFVEGDEEEITDIFFVGTVLGKESLLYKLLDPNIYPEWKSAKFKSVEKFADRTDLWDKWAELYSNNFDILREKTAWDFYKKNEKEMLEGVKIVWPEGDPYYKLMITYYFSRPAFYSEKQNEPIDTTKLIVLPEDIHYYSFKSNKDIQNILLDQRTVYFGGIDPSVGKRSDIGDYSAICTIARCNNTGILLVVDFDLARRNIDAQITAIMKKHLKYHYKSFVVEENAFQYVLSEQLRKRSMQDGVYIPIKGVNQYQDKKMRFEGVAPFIKDGTIVFDSDLATNNRSYAKAIDQIITFTGEGDEEDDAVDALVMAFNAAKKQRFKTIYKSTR